MKIIEFELLKKEDRNVSRTEKTIALTIASIVNIALGVLLSMISTRFLTKREIAINSQTFLAYNSFIAILNLGIPNGIYFYLSKNENREKTVAKECIICCTVMGAVYSIFILLGGNYILASSFKNEEIAQTLYWMIPYALIFCSANVLTCFFVYDNRLRFNAIYSVIQGIAILLVSIFVAVLYRTGTAMVITRVVMTCVFGLVTFYLVFAILPNDNSGISLSGLRMLIITSVPLGIAAVFGTLSQNLDQWIISVLLDPDTYAVYTQGARELPLISTITASISTVMITDLTKAANEKNYQKAIELFRMIASKSSVFLMPIMVFCFVTAKKIITILYTDSYIDATVIFRIYLLYMPIRIIYYDPLLIAFGKSKFLMYKTIASIFVNAILSLAFVYVFSAKGAAIATILSVYAFSVPINLYVISKTTSINWKLLLPFEDVLRNIFLAMPGALGCIVLSLTVREAFPVLIEFIVEFLVFGIVTAIVYKKHDVFDAFTMLKDIRIRIAKKVDRK